MIGQSSACTSSMKRFMMIYSIYAFVTEERTKKKIDYDIWLSEITKKEDEQRQKLLAEKALKKLDEEKA